MLEHNEQSHQTANLDKFSKVVVRRGVTKYNMSVAFQTHSPVKSFTTPGQLPTLLKTIQILDSALMRLNHNAVFEIYWFKHPNSPSSNHLIVQTSNISIGGLVVKLAVAILHRTVSASPGFDSRPMHFCCSTGRYKCGGGGGDGRGT